MPEATDPADAPPDPPAGIQRARRRPSRRIILAAAGVVVVVAGIVGYFVWSSTFTVKGSWTYACNNADSQVNVYDNSGALLAMGRTDEGTPTFYSRCIYRIDVPGVKSGKDGYVITMRGVQSEPLSQDQASNMNLVPTGSIR